ncbi:WD40-like Beta Propeller Repeat [Prevotella sp. ne3005]|uniref:TolB family protein n=1 Tax=Prevotella sp. ne3005 TaxID=1761887 RepID=UPI0008D64D79|nr:PD40 domain-containing protein [Prevotella sp. ne3005]SEN26422.1 WD40-like Beta Propeller Repeat [Prevotella sp. ne3005]
MRKAKTSSLCSCLLGICLFVACTSLPKDVTHVDEQPAIYPDYIGVTIPTGIAPLDFTMADDSVTTIDVEVKGSLGGSLHTNGIYADFEIDVWHELLEQNKGGVLTVTVCAERNGKWKKYQDFPIYVSNDSLGEWGITYRRIAPGYEFYGHMGIYQRELSTFEETALLDNGQLNGQCINCHTANRTNPDMYVFHIRGKHGATVMNRSHDIEKLKATNDTLGITMVYPYWHPNGRYCAFSTNKTSQMFHTANPAKRIEVYDSQSDVFVYDTETQNILCDTLIMKKYWAENTPSFSPDGKWLYFTTALRQIYPTDYDKEKYSLCRVSFDETSGKIGTYVDTLICANKTGKSVTWPRPSYNGRYLMYTQIDYGYFSIWHPEADLWLLDLKTGESRAMDEVNSTRAESFHNWSKNSRWFLFTSRRDDGLYTRIYLASIDGNGKITKPFMLPQRNPKEYYRRLMYSYNTPDFTDRSVNIDKAATYREIESDERTETKMR